MLTGIKTYVSTSTIHNYEPLLASYYPSGYSNWDTQINLALHEITQDLKRKNKKVRLYCVPYLLQSETTLTATTEGTVTETEDVAERLTFVVNTTGKGVFSLYGTNDKTNYYLIASLTSTSLTAQTLSVMFTSGYKYYRVDFTDTDGATSTTYSAYLVETSFFLAHVYKSLSLIFQLLTDNSTDMWQTKFEYYSQKYEFEMSNMIATYDEDESETITEDEVGRQVNIITMRR